MTSLTLYTNPMSRGQIARWMLEETGVPYDTVILDYGTTMKAPDYLAINPMGKVPAIRHGDTIVTECAAVCAYLADAFPAANLAPPTDARGTYYRWLFFAAGPLESAITNKAMGFVVPEGRERSAGYGTLETCCRLWNRRFPYPNGCAAISSPPPTSMSAPRSIGASPSAPSPPHPPSPPMPNAYARARPINGKRRSTTP